MYMFIASILVTLILAWVWGSRGFLSAMIHMLCVIIAGAIAFGVWETAGYAILDAWEKKWIVDIAWGVALAVPFALTLAILRLVIDKLIPFNTDLDGASNLIGGMACGAISGVIAMGIMTISITHCRINAESVEFNMVEYDSNGSLKKVGGFQSFFPRATGWLYAYLSENSLRTDTPMAKYRPDMPYEGALLRTTFNNGTSRNTIVPKAVTLESRYTVGIDPSVKNDVRSLLATGTNDTQTVTLFGDDASPGGKDTNYYIEGYVVKFRSQARETQGGIIIGNAQVNLVIRNPDDTRSMTLFPVAMVSQAVNLEGDDRVRFWRWGFAASGKYVASVGGADDPPMAFEFLVPKGWKPIALNVKGVRLDPDKVPPGKPYKTPEERIEAIKDYAIIPLPVGAKGFSKREFGIFNTAKVTTPYPVDGSKVFTPDAPISVTEGLPFQMNLSVDNKGGLKTDEQNKVVEGTAKFKNEQTRLARGTDQKLQVRTIYSGDGTVLVQVDISNSSAIAFTKNKIAVEAVGAPKLMDNLGNEYSAIGYAYQDRQETWIQIEPLSPIGSVTSLPYGGPSESRDDQKFILFYRVSANVKLKSFTVGGNVVVKIEPTIEIKKFN